MQAFPPDFHVRKRFGRITRKIAETVHLHKISSPEGNQVEKLVFYAVV